MRCELAHMPSIYGQERRLLCGSFFSIMVTIGVGSAGKWIPTCTHDTTAAQSYGGLAGAHRPVPLHQIEAVAARKRRLGGRYYRGPVSRRPGGGPRYAPAGRFPG